MQARRGYADSAPDKAAEGEGNTNSEGNAAGTSELDKAKTDMEAKNKEIIDLKVGASADAFCRLDQGCLTANMEDRYLIVISCTATLG